MKTKLLDLAERAGATFLQAFLAAETIDQTQITQVSALKLAAVAGAFSVAKYVLVQTSAYLATTPTVAAITTPPTAPVTVTVAPPADPAPAPEAVAA